jgi:hypothetical protein
MFSKRCYVYSPSDETGAASLFEDLANTAEAASNGRNAFMITAKIVNACSNEAQDVLNSTEVAPIFIRRNNAAATKGPGSSIITHELACHVQ